MSMPSRTLFVRRLRGFFESPLLLSVVALWGLLLFMEFARPAYFLHDDNADWFIGAYLHDFRVLTETGRVAEVNYYQHGGEPFVEQGQTAVLYPPVYLGVGLAKWVTGDVRWSLEWIAAINLTFALVGFALWLRQGGVAPRLAALAGLAWTVNPFVLTIGDSWIFTTSVAAWMPWLFWALDRLLARPSAGAAFYLGISSSFLFLQGYVQYFAYAALFLTLYALFQFVTRRETRTLAVIYYLAVSVLIWLILCLPMLLPMASVVGDSGRSGPMEMGAALFYSVAPEVFLKAQVISFARWVAFGASAAILFCPALWILPAVGFAFYHGDKETRQRLFILLLLGLLAVIFSTKGHWLLSQLPIYNHFRWPFKVFLFVHFFFIAVLAWTASYWTKPSASNPQLGKIAAPLCLTAVFLANLSISLVYHDDDCLSQTLLTSSVSPLPPSLDLQRGRVEVFADDLPQQFADYFYTRAYATYYAFPSIGGYNPLARREIFGYALSLDYPNICSDPITPDYAKNAEARSVRYWIVDPNCPHYAEAKTIPSLKVVETRPNRVIFEDTLATPLVHSTAAPSVPCAMKYVGNSMLVSLSGVASPVEASVAPTDGWWYRIDHGTWLRPAYQNDGLHIDFKPTDQLLEISYFDPRYHIGKLISAGLIIVLVVLLTTVRFSRRDEQPAS